MWLKFWKAFCGQWRDFYSDAHNRGFFLFLIVALFSAWGKNHWCRPGLCWIWALALPVFLLFAAFCHRSDIRHPNRPPLRTSTEPQEGPFGRKLRDALILVPLFSFLMIQVEHFGWFEHLDNAFLDIAVRLRVQTRTTDVVIIEIDDKDYRVFFDAISPLKASTVWTIIQLIQDAKPQPRLIAVDLDTRGSDWNTLAKTVGEDKIIDPRKIIWAEVPWINDGQITPTCVLGGKLTDWNKGTGVDLLPRDEDGVVRRYQDQYPVTSGLSSDCSTSVPPPDCVPHAFHRVVAARSGKELNPETKTEGDYYIRFLSRQSFRILCLRGLRKLEEKERDNLLGGKIVLLGGTFAAARDSYSTPLGEMPGVEIVADAVESDLMPSPATPFWSGIFNIVWSRISQIGSGQVHVTTPSWPSIFDIVRSWISHIGSGQVHVATPFWRWIFDICSGLVITVIYFIWRNRPGTALVLSLLSLFAPLVVGLVFLRLWAVWLNAAPVMVGMMFHEGVESAHTAAEVSER